MVRLFLLLLLLFTVNQQTVSAQQTQEKFVTAQSNELTGSKSAAPVSQSRPFKVPAEIRLIVKVEELPGIANPQSFWEGFYEIRVADWSAVVEKTTLGGETQALGEVLLQFSSQRRSFLENENRAVTISVPVTGSLLERLQQQAKNPQAFLLRSSVRIFDAKLDKNYALKLNRIWQLKLFPDGEATIAIKVEPDGGYNIWGPTPKKLPAGYTTVGLPPDKIPPTKKP